MYHVIFTKRALKDLSYLKAAGLSEKAKQIVEIIGRNPFQNPPEYEKLLGNLNGYYSRRINIKHRLVYEVLEQENIVRILRMWSHYEF